MPTVPITATVQPGAGVASKNLKFQMPHVIGHFPELKDIYTATINLQLDKPLLISKLQRTTPTIRWWDVDAGRPGFWHLEQFSILTDQAGISPRYTDQRCLAFCLARFRIFLKNEEVFPTLLPFRRC
jgi:hypothetical protein